MGKSEGFPLLTAPLLDITRKYILLGPDEWVWIFSYDSSKDAIGEVFSSWQAYAQKPGGLALPQGGRTEMEVIEFFDKHWRQLDDDDKMNLILFLYHGGLESFLKENHKETKDES